MNSPRKSLLRFLFLGAALGVSACATTQEVPQAEPEKEVTDEAVPSTPSVEAVSNLALASQLAEYGRRENAPLALASAAQILIETPADPVEGDPEMEAIEGAPAARGQKTAAAPDLDPADLLSEARRMAAGNENLLETIDRLADRADSRARGAVVGPREGFLRVNAYSTATQRVTFRGQESAIVYINGDNDTDLDLYIYDEHGNLICASNGWTDEEACRWVPRYTGTFQIRVRNLGGVYNIYYMAHN